MAYQFEKAVTTSTPIQHISSVIKEVGEDLDFLGPFRKTRVKLGALSGSGAYGFFSPNADDDPFAAAGQKPDWSIGWQWSVSHTSTVMNTWDWTTEMGWSVIFHVYDNGTSRTVRAKANGSMVRREPTRFIELVFGQL